MKVYESTCISKFTLRDENDQPVIDGEEYFPGCPVQSQELGRTEVIIGLYGTKDKQVIRSLGFIVADTQGPRQSYGMITDN